MYCLSLTTGDYKNMETILQQTNIFKMCTGVVMQTGKRFFF